MRTRIDFIKESRVPALLEGVGSDVTLAWKEWPAGTTPDAVYGAPQGTPTARTQTVQALLYFVSATTQIRQFAEVQAGDCIATFAPDLPLKKMDSLRFIIEDEEWSSKPVSEALANYWCQVANRKLYQVVLLRKGT